MPKDVTRNVRVILYVMVVSVIVLALLGVSQGQIDFVVSIFTTLLVGAVTSLVAASILEALTGNALKRVLLTVEIVGFEFSISLFLIATVLLKLLIFR